MKKVIKYLSICLLVIISCCLFSACGSNIKLKINFDSNGGTSCSAIYYEVGKSFNMPSDPTKENYIFDGWYEDNDTWEKPFTANTILNYPLTMNMEITAYAKWVQVNYNLTFDSNGGSDCENLYIEDLSTELPTPIKSGYTFVGWYFDNQTFNNVFTLNSTFELDEQREIIVHAKWARNLKVVYHLNNNEDDVVLYHTGNFPLLDGIKKNGFSFENWSFADNANIEFNVNKIAEYEENGQLDLYAVWQEYEILSAEIYDWGNVKDFYEWGEEIDFSETTIKINYKNGKNRVTNILNYQLLNNFGAVAEYELNNLTAISFGWENGVSYKQTNFQFLIVPATIYLDVPIKIYSDIQIISVNNYNECVYYNDESALFNANSTLSIQDKNGETYYVNIFENLMHSEDLIIEEVDKSIDFAINDGNSFLYYYLPLKDRIDGFISNKAYINRKINIYYKTTSFRLSYKLVVNEIEELKFVDNDFYFNPYGFYYPNLNGNSTNEIPRRENLSLTKSSEKNSVRISIKFKDNDTYYIGYLEDLINCEILEDISIQDDIATATIIIDNVELNLEANTPICLDYDYQFNNQNNYNINDAPGFVA